ncbi:MAG: GreA/GreB family elongation factor [Myxococcota bacterium]
MDKAFLVEQLTTKIRESLGVAEREMTVAADAARDGEDAKERREDTRMAIEYSALAKGQERRAQAAHMALSQLETFRPGPIAKGGKVEMGALIEIEEEESGEGRTLFLAPVGAGIELTGPDGDGFLSVVTPSSPIGRAAWGRKLGDSIDVTVEGNTRTWEITWVG